MLKHLKTFWVFSYTIFSMIVLSVWVLLLSFFSKKNFREKIDKIVYCWAKKTLSLAEATITLKHAEYLQFEPEKNYLFITNHTSLYDIPVIYAALPATIRMIAKKELSRVPLWGHAMRRSEVPFIDRKNRLQAIKDLAYAKELMKSGVKIWISPEGTRSKDGQLADFKKGAFVMAIETGATIIPIGIKGAHELLPAKSLKLKFGQSILLNVGEPIDASQYDISDKQALLTLTRARVAALLN